MQKKMMLLALCFMCVGLIGCSSKKENTAAQQTESSTTTESVQTSKLTETTQLTQDTTTLPDQTETALPDKTEAASVEQNENGSDALTENQALDAIKNYYSINNLALTTDSSEYNSYWDVATNESNEIVVLYRSYTGAQMRYYIDPVSGETYVTEFVPGIIDTEQRTEESFNARDYLT
ncbi:MAG: hypothetical protein K5898_04760 [Ruminococcus sp.]|uniref:hypothetical protein n=1 Tax=Ruminococcus sp. TaxID=41978 RepID=UPI002600A4C8|nr:hypothetical protein [Ruminococcus sp.]MCR4794468.1 hypothetical protein [Ruminococcus sp.]